MIKYYGTAELLLIKSASVTLSRVKFIRHYADMAELADAYGSGPYVRKNMQVQVLLSAPAGSPRGQVRASLLVERNYFSSHESHLFRTAYKGKNNHG